jgi:predicted RNA-binding protein with PIN domain
MERFSAEVENRIVRALGAYLRATPPRELPVSVRRFGSFGSKALIPHREALMEAFDDAALRARIVEWLDDGKTPLKRPESDLLRTVAERKDGWDEILRGEERARSPVRKSSRSDVERLEREREKSRKARDELQRAKGEAADARKQLKAQIAERDRALADLQRRIRDAENDATMATRELQRLERAAERDRRKHEREIEKLKAEKEKLQADTRTAKRQARELMATTGKLERELSSAKASRSTPKRSGSKSPAHRVALAVPKGRLADAKETLEEWLAAPLVHLLIDGYNVTKAKGGFGDLRLESQRERLMDEVGRLARKKAVPATIVFDGADLPAGSVPRRRKRSHVAVEYSRPPDVGDDHLVARLELMPRDPVVVVTNDRELQDRVRALGATVATSDQLLRLIR